MKIRTVALAVLVLLAFWMPSLAASEETAESRAAYRRATLNELVAESQRKRYIPHRSGNQYTADSHFGLGKDAPFSLEPINASVGDVVGA